VQQRAGGEGAARDGRRDERHGRRGLEPDGARRRAGWLRGRALALGGRQGLAPARRLLLRSRACLLGLEAPLARPEMPGKLHRHGE
jgi:hypothetical protein